MNRVNIVNKGVKGWWGWCRVGGIRNKRGGIGSGIKRVGARGNGHKKIGSVEVR